MTNKAKAKSISSLQGKGTLSLQSKPVLPVRTFAWHRQRRRALTVLSLAGFILLCAACASAAPPRQQTAGDVFAWGYNGYENLCIGTDTNANTPVEVTNFPSAMAISASLGHTLALLSDGTVWACGANGNGALGTGSSASYLSTFAQVSGLTGVVQIAAADSGTNSFALKSDGTVWAWGSNSGYGILGDGTTTAGTAPVQVSGLSSVTAISVDPEGNDAMALESNGTVWTWGYNGDGELGNGGISNSSAPVQVSGLTGVIAVSMGTYNGYALESDGTVWAWGNNNYGELGSATTAVTSNVPIQVAGLSGITAISGSPIPGGSGAGGAALALRSDGTVWAWGYNGVGQLGNGTSGGSSATPAEVSNLTGVTAIAAGGETGMALESNGTLWVWGQGNNGELGLGSATLLSYSPVQVTSLSGVTAIAAGPDDDLALESQAVAQAWGDNSVGELGNGTTGSESTGYDVPTPGAVSDLSGLSVIAGGGAFSLALLGDGTVWAWGANTDGQLGNGSTTNSDTPVQVSDLSGIKALAAGGDQAMALDSSGNVWAWGCDEPSETGSCSSYSTTPSQVNGVSGVVAIAAGYLHGLALESDGTVWAWGFNSMGQLGNGTTTASSSPVQVSGLSGIAAIAAGYDFSVALRSDGTVWAWGDNEYGQLGSSATLNSYSATPVQVLGPGGNGFLSGVSAIAAEFVSSEALASGNVWTWGDNTQDELGNPTVGFTPTPVPVLDGVGNPFSNVTAIATNAASTFSLALAGDGTVWAWGNGGQGQLGIGNYNGSYPPVEVCFLNGAPAIAAGGDFGLALTLPPGSQPLCISAATSATVEVGQTVSLLVTTQGSPTPSLTETGTLPAGLSFVDNGNGTGTLSGTVAAGSVGTYSVAFTAQNGVAPNGTQNTTLTVIQAPTTISLTASPNPANAGQSVTLTATVAVSAPGSGSPTGTVTFMDGANTLGTAALTSSGAATFSTSSLAAGSHSLSATYGGDANFTGSASATVSLTVEAATPPPTNGSVWFWGNDSYSPGLYSTTPTQISGLSGMVSIAAGMNHSLALASDGSVWAFGGNDHGQLGNGTACCLATATVGFVGGTDVSTQVNSLSGMTAISAGQDDSLALNGDGTVSSWGMNLFGELGNGATTDSDTPVQVSNLTSVISIAAGSLFNLAVLNNGTVWAWGYNGEGELGNGTDSDSDTPVQVSGLSGVSAVAGGTRHGMALVSGVVWTWGDDTDGELGNGANTDSDTPVQVTGLSNITAISAGGEFSLALRNDGTVWAWGNNQYGELGSGSTGNSSTPVQVSGLSGIVAIAAGFEHALALRNDGTVWAWGDNSDGELGNGTTSSSSTPVQVSLPCGVAASAIAAGQNFSLVLSQTSAAAAPCITSPDAAAFFEGQAGSFTVMATGAPTPSLTESGALPSGVTFVDNGNGTATLSGTGATGSDGFYPITITAENGVTPNAMQTFHLNMDVIGTSGGESNPSGNSGNGGNGADNEPNSCGCTVAKTVTFSKPTTVNPSQTSVPISAISAVPFATISSGPNSGQSVSGLITVTTSASNGLAAGQVAPVSGGIPSGDPVVTIKGYTGTNLPYNGQFQVVNLISATQYQVLNDAAADLPPLSGGTTGTSLANTDPLQSPSGKYTLTPQIGTDPTGQQYYSDIQVTLTSSGDVVQDFGQQPITMHWGFSPDDDRLFMHYTPVNDPTNYCMDNLMIYDLSASPVRQINQDSAIPVWASTIQFSASGEYLLYAANNFSGGCPSSSALAGGAPPTYVQLTIYRIRNVTSQDVVYQTNYSFTPGVVPGGAYQNFGGVGWGFSPDVYGPETSFVFAYANSSSTLEWTLVNVADGKAVENNPSVSAAIMTTASGSTALEASWLFDTCGDLAALIVPGPAQNQSEVTFYNTGTGAPLASETLPVSPSSVTLNTTPAGQEIVYGSVTQLPLPDTCGDTNTPTGTNVVVIPLDSGSSTSPITVLFASVTQAGETTVTSTTTAPTPPTPTEFQLGDPPTYYEVSTTANYATSTTPAITICISYAGVSYMNPSTLEMGHYVNGEWVTVTAPGYPDTANKIVCGTVSSLSPFALFEPIGPVPAGVTATAGTPQSTTIGSSTVAPFQATVTDSNGDLLSGITVTFTAPNLGSAGTFSGASQVAVISNASGIATAPVFTVNGTAGSYVVTATVSGVTNPANFAMTNLQAATMVLLSTSATGAVADGTPVVLTATVTASVGTPTGTVNFLNGSTSLGTATLADGVASLTTSALPPGTNSITADYEGNANLQASGSQAVTVAVNSPNFSFSASTTSVSLAAGESTNPPITLTVTPEGFSGTVTVSCGALPAYINCTFSPNSGILTFASGATSAQTIELTITVASTVAQLERRGPGLMALTLPLGVLILLPTTCRGRKRLRAYLLCAALAAVLGTAMVGCNRYGFGLPPTSKLPPAGAQTVIVTATGSGISQQVQFTVNVTN